MEHRLCRGLGAGACSRVREDFMFMNNWDRLNYAERKLDEAILHGTDADVLYWRGYRDGVYRCIKKGVEHREDLSDGALE